MITIWHNPRCSKSRQALALLQERGPVTIRLYLQDAPSIDELYAASTALGLSPIAMMRTGEAVFKELNLSKADPDVTLIAAMAAHPILIERPIVFSDSRAAVGRPPEAVLALL
ncbi:arsenate reductase (glutaredoxin) [Thalassovita taeanensis]|uniref:Arsenate reductase n=1 Tax=Thalassovita taeanensis TaxID=657014 RepID=A0A1H9GAV4_9RHOB|nr:arsenate reductase (glutaredoxin) [Thalassovita taeanensis]SEQ47237.1 arsenate reductase [Thalassovita taeanensis]